MNVEVVQTLLTDLLASTVAVVDLPPARQFVAHGAWAHDCESVTSRLGEMRLEPLLNVGGATASLVTLHATVIRCVSGTDEHGMAPTAAAIQADALLLADDLGDMIQGLSDRWGLGCGVPGSLFPNVPEFCCGTVDFAGARAIGPEGKLAGWELTLIVRS